MTIYEPTKCRYHDSSTNIEQCSKDLKPARVRRYNGKFYIFPLHQSHTTDICMVCSVGFKAYNNLDGQSKYEWVTISFSKKRGRPFKPKFTKDIEL